MIRELRTFVAVSQAGSFAAAGERIGLTQAAVSGQIQRLEAHLGFPLFERTGRSSRLNQHGHQLLGRAQALLLQFDQLGQAEEDEGPAVRVVVGAIASVQRAQLPAVMAGFHRDWPGSRSRIVPGLSMDLVNQVDAGELDLALVIRPPFALQSDLRWTTLQSEPFRLIVPRRVAGEDWTALLAEQPFVRYDRASFGGRLVDRFLRQHHLAVREVCELDELDAIVTLVAQGLGVALVPQTPTLRRWPAGVRAVDLGAQTFHRDIGMLHRARRTLAEPVRDLADRFAAAALSPAAAESRSRR